MSDFTGVGIVEQLVGAGPFAPNFAVIADSGDDFVFVND